MKPLLTLIAVALLLSGCGFWNRSAKPSFTERVVLSPLPEEARTCAAPADLDLEKARNGVMPAEELLKGWARDRTRLVSCKRKHETVVNYYDEVRTGFLTGRYVRLGEVNNTSTSKSIK